MKKEAEDLFTIEVLNKGANLYSVDLDSLKELAGFENFIYGGKIDNKEIVLRYCHSSHRTKEQINAEMDWLFYLKQNGAAVCGPIHSSSNQLVEEVCVGETSFYVSMFEKAEGTHVDISNNRANTSLFVRWGKAIGELHKLTKDYSPSAGIIPRSDYMLMSSNLFTTYLPDEADVKAEIDRLFNDITSLPKDRSNYFLTHTDLHAGNFYYDDNRLWLFDFDDCAQHYLVHDLAMPLFYNTWLYEAPPQEVEKFSEVFMVHLLTGYLSEYDLSFEDFKTLPLFLRLRDCDLYAILNKEWDESERTEKRTKLLKRMRDRIINHKAVVELNLFDIYQKANALKHNNSI